MRSSTKPPGTEPGGSAMRRCKRELAVRGIARVALVQAARTCGGSLTRVALVQGRRARRAGAIRVRRTGVSLRAAGRAVGIALRALVLVGGRLVWQRRGGVLRIADGHRAERHRAPQKCRNT